MEIDFLGLKSPRYDIEHEGSSNVFTDAANGGVETSLSLRTSSSLDFHREILNFSKNKTKKKWEFGGNSDKMIPSCSGSSTVCSLGPYNHENSIKVEQHSLLLVATPVFHRPSATGFLYDLNDTAAASFRNISELPATEPPMLYSPSPNLFKQQQKQAESSMYVAGNASTGLSRSGNYTPTVAMARRATLARFLEKRLHRINQVRTSHIMGRSVNGTHSETCETSITKSNNKKKNNLLKRRS